MQSVGEQEKIYFGAKYVLDVGNEKVSVGAVLQSLDPAVNLNTNHEQITLEKINDER